MIRINFAADRSFGPTAEGRKPPLLDQSLTIRQCHLGARPSLSISPINGLEKASFNRKSNVLGAEGFWRGVLGVESWARKVLGAEGRGAFERRKGKLGVNGYYLPWLVGIAALTIAVTAHAQSAATDPQGTDYSAGKTAEQLFKSDCSGCHKTVQGLAKATRGFGLDDFLRKHYTTSRETAALLANYLHANAAPADSKPAPTARGKKTPPAAPAPHPPRCPPSFRFSVAPSPTTTAPARKKRTSRAARRDRPATRKSRRTRTASRQAKTMRHRPERRRGRIRRSPPRNPTMPPTGPARIRKPRANRPPRKRGRVATTRPRAPRRKRNRISPFRSFLRRRPFPRPPCARRSLPARRIFPPPPWLPPPRPPRLPRGA